jgi:molybdate transport system permease protein
MNPFSLNLAEWEALRLSLWVAGWAVVSSLPAGMLTAWLLARKAFPGKMLLDGLLHLPLVLPPVVMGYVLLILFGRKGLLGDLLFETFGVTFAFNWKGAAVASAVMAFPLLVRALRLSIESIDRGLEDAARTLGSTPIKVFFRITLPLSVPGILAGAILAFARSLGEFGATITFVSNIPGETRTLPLALYTALQTVGGEDVAMRLCVISGAIALLALIGSDLLNRYFSWRLRG